MNRLIPFVPLLVAMAGCGVNPDKIKTHELYADDRAELDAGDRLAFAVVGATRATLPRRGDEAQVPSEVIQDIRGEIPVRGLSFVVLTGGYVRGSSNAEWEAFAERWSDVLQGETESPNKARKPVLAVPGTSESLGDRRLRGYGAAFEEIGRNIGHNRVASWYTFDVEVDDTDWRFLFLDSNRKQLGSRWREQDFWLPKVVTGNEFDKLLVFMPDPLVTLATGTQMDPQDGPSHLLEVIQDHSDVMKLHAVFQGGAPTNEFYLLSGTFGEAYVVAGNAGIPAQDLRRWGAADDAGLKDVSLAPGYDASLLQEFDRWVEDLELPERYVDQAKARGSWETYTGTYEGSVFPIQGWWIVELEDEEMEITFRMRRHDGTFHDLYTTRYTESNGWTWKPE